MKGKVSVILPVYNVGKYIDRCMESLVHQTYSNLEIILIDDGATDNSPQICDDWTIKDKRVKVIHKENGGVSSARNVGLKNASGEYLMFVDPDDYISLDAIEKFIAKMPEYDCVYSKYNIVGKTTTRCNEINIEKLTKNIDIGYFIGNRCKHKKNEVIKQSIMGSVCRILFKRELFRDICFPENLRYSEDFVVIMEILAKKPKIGALNEYLYNYYQNDQSYTAAVKLSKIDDSLSILPYMYKYFREPRFRKKLDYYEVGTILNIIYILRSNNKLILDLNEDQQNFVRNNFTLSKIINFCKNESSLRLKLSVLKNKFKMMLGKL